MSVLSTLRESTRRLIGEEDTANTHFDDGELNDYLNQATTFLGTEMEWSIQIATATSVQNQALYTLPDDFIALTSVYYDNRLLTVLNRSDLPVINANWMNATSGAPLYCYKADNGVVGVFPAPDLLNTGKFIQIEYIQIPATLVQDTDLPNLHIAFHMCLPFYAAFLCESKLGNDKKAAVDLALYTSHKKALMSKVQRFSDDLMRFKWV